MPVVVEVGGDAAVPPQREVGARARLTSTKRPPTLWKSALRGRPPLLRPAVVVDVRVRVDDEEVEPAVVVVVEPAEAAAHHRVGR